MEVPRCVLTGNSRKAVGQWPELEEFDVSGVGVIDLAFVEALGQTKLRCAFYHCATAALREESGKVRGTAAIM